MNRYHCVFILLALTALFWNCSENVAGGASETENTSSISGIVRDETVLAPNDDRSNKVAGAAVHLYPDEYNPYGADTLPAEWKTETDGRGKYQLTKVTAGTYNIQVWHPDDDRTALLQGIVVAGSGGNEIKADTAVLRNPGTVRMSLMGLNDIQEGGCVYLPGTAVYTEVTAQELTKGTAELAGVPAAIFDGYNVMMWENDPDPLNYRGIPFEVISGKTTTISPFSNWMDKSKIVVNTSSSGADVDEDVLNFPVLVRLNRTVAPALFDQAQTGGRDIRFSKSDELTPLPYEIELWNNVTEEALVWVRLDTAYGGNDSQFIYMYAGQPGALSESSGADVFDTTADFSGVWHLAFGLRDATAFGNHGVDHGTENLEDGFLGQGRMFGDAGDHFTVPQHTSLLFGTGDFTLSLFFNLRDSLSVTSQLLSKRVEDGNSFEIQLGTNYSVYGYAADRLGPAPAYSAATIAPGQWYHAAVRRRTGSVQVFLDGMPDGNPADIPNDVDSDRDLFIGIDPYVAEETFTGSMDEIRISSVARSDTWIKLSYENQKPGSKVVSIKQ